MIIAVTKIVFFMGALHGWVQVSSMRGLVCLFQLEKLIKLIVVCSKGTINDNRVL